MKEIVDEAINWVKSQDVEGCITGSCLLDYYEGQDIDIFTYSEAAFTKLVYSMHFNPIFQLIEPIEQWKFKEWTTTKQSSLKKLGLITIKFKYNLAVDVNVIFKLKDTNLFNVISSFDLDIICKGYDLQTKEYLDLTTNPGKIASWNKWNPAFQSTEIWSVSRILRQLERVFKYHKRGYNTDAVVVKYMELIDVVQEFQSIFSSENFNEKLKITQENTLIIKQLCELWLSTHTITDEQLELLKTKIKEI